MNPFDDPIGDRGRYLYGKYRPRFSARKRGDYVHTTYIVLNGTSWVDLPWIASPFPVVKDWNISVYSIAFTHYLIPAGILMFRILINGQKVYPFGDDAECNSYGGHRRFECWSIPVKPGESFIIQGRSTDAADTTTSLKAYVTLVEFEQGHRY